MTKDQAVKRVLDVMRSYIGYKEKRSNAQLDDPTANAGANNYTRFAQILDSIGYYNGRKQGKEWCDVCVDCAFYEAFSDGYPANMTLCQQLLYQPPKSTGAGTGYSAGFFKANGAWYQDPEPSDQIFFQTKAKEICHTGVVERVEGDLVHTIEGNANNMVGRHVYMLGASNIAGYGRPNWALVTSEAAGSKPVTHATLRRGSTGTEVHKMQQQLLDLCYKLPRYGADGDFGDETEAAVRAFQRDHKQADGQPLMVDGICGPLTWAALDEAAAGGKVSERDNGTGESYLIYTIKKGDTLTKIAVAHRTTVQALKMLNGIKNANLIFTGQKIRIPN